MKLKVHEYDLPLKYKFGIPRETRTVQKTAIVEVSEGNYSGYGECVANHKYYKFTIDMIREDISSVENDLKNIDLATVKPEEIWGLLAAKLAHNPFAQCALDMSLTDLYGKIHNKKTHEIWELDTRKNPVTDYTIGIDTLDMMVKKLEEFNDW